MQIKSLGLIKAVLYLSVDFTAQRQHLTKMWRTSYISVL